MTTDVPREQHTEGRVAKVIEPQTAKLPSDVWLMGIEKRLKEAGTGNDCL